MASMNSTELLSPTSIFFDRILSCAQEREPLSMAVCWPCSIEALTGALEAERRHLIRPLLVGPRCTLLKLAAQLSIDEEDLTIIEADTPERAAALACELCHRGEAEALMKGSLHTDVFMHAVLDDESGMVTDRRISHVFVFDTPQYERPLFVSDAAIHIAPDLHQKMEITQNAIEVAHALGVQRPRVAILSAVECVDPSIRSTVDAAALSKMAERGQITGALVDGPLSFDTAVSAHSAAVKGLVSSVAGDADILIVPDLDAGNLLAKELEYFGKAVTAAVAVGGRVPIVLTSRADDATTRCLSCAVASILVAASNCQA